MLQLLSTPRTPSASSLNWTENQSDLSVLFLLLLEQKPALSTRVFLILGLEAVGHLFLSTLHCICSNI